MQIIRTILIILLFYYGFKFLFKVVAPFLLTRWITKKTQQFQQQNQFADAEKVKEFAKQKEGEVKIKTTKTNKSETDGIGDYVDYEEVKE